MGTGISYMGAKSGSGVYQLIINLMPPHHTYIEPFLGSGQIMRLKAPATRNIGLELDADAVWKFKAANPSIACELFTTDAFEWIKAASLDSKTLVYCDPPYVLSTRTGRDRYKHELTDEDHLLLLQILKTLDCMVILSGYRNKLYEQELGAWFSVDYQATTRGGVRTETVWCNFKPSKMHYHTFAGKNYTDRQRIKKKAERWGSNYKKLPPGEQQAILAAMLCTDSGT